MEGGNGTQGKRKAEALGGNSGCRRGDDIIAVLDKDNNSFKDKMDDAEASDDEIHGNSNTGDTSGDAPVPAALIKGNQLIDIREQLLHQMAVNQAMLDKINEVSMSGNGADTKYKSSADKSRFQPSDQQLRVHEFITRKGVQGKESW
jgi:hypothetical protein